jgi:molybdenum cofactor cytidylyltransferase
MPNVDAALIDRLIAAFDPAGACEICVPMHEGRRGNPVLWARHFFAPMAALEGDRGARGLIRRHAGVVREIEAGEGCLLDVDTPAALDALGEG